MNEVDKVRSSQLTSASSPEAQERFKRTEELLLKLSHMDGYDEKLWRVLEGLIPSIPASVTIWPLFCCGHDDDICLGKHVFINPNCTFLDGRYATIETHTLVGPNVQVYTPRHPLDYPEWRVEQEYAYPVTIGEGCWTDGGAVVHSGVTIGDRYAVGTGNVVTKGILSDCVTVNNPAKIIHENEAKKE